MREQKMSGPELAAKMESSYRSVDEAIRRGRCGVDLLVKIAIALDVSICELVYDKNLKNCNQNSVKNDIVYENYDLAVAIIELLKNHLPEIDLNQATTTSFFVTPIESNMTPFTKRLCIGFACNSGEIANFVIEVSKERININFFLMKTEVDKEYFTNQKRFSISEIGNINADERLVVLVENNEIKQFYISPVNSFENFSDTHFKIVDLSDLLGNNVASKKYEFTLKADKKI